MRRCSIAAAAASLAVVEGVNLLTGVVASRVLGVSLLNGVVASGVLASPPAFVFPLPFFPGTPIVADGGLVVLFADGFQIGRAHV